MGSEQPKEMEFWTKDEYQKFANAMMDKPLSYYAFEMLYWCGIREGELLALTPADFDFEKGTVKISKSYQRLNGHDLITTPKTEKSNRTIVMPDFLVDEIKEYLSLLYDVGEDDRMFPVTKSYLYREMERGCKETGVKRIRVHDIRHSAVSLLIDMGFSATAMRICSPPSKMKWSRSWNLKGARVNVIKEFRQPGPLAQQDSRFPGVAGGR